MADEEERDRLSDLISEIGMAIEELTKRDGRCGERFPEIHEDIESFKDEPTAENAHQVQRSLYDVIMSWNEGEDAQELEEEMIDSEVNINGHPTTLNVLRQNLNEILQVIDKE